MEMMDKLKTLNIGAINVEPKEKGFTQIYNTPIQHDLRNLNTIGLLTYILSLPADWVVRKTHLHNQFTRRTVDNAWKHLVEENYAIDISFYATGYGKGRIHLYKVSDEKYTDDDIYNYYKNVKETFAENGISINEESFETNNNVDMTGFPFDVRSVQYNGYCTNGTTTKNLGTKELSNKYLNTPLPIVNKDAIKSTEEVPPKEKPEVIWTNACNEYYSTFAVGRLSKKQWNTLVKKFVTETIEAGRHKTVAPNKISSYIYVALETMALNGDMKREQVALFEVFDKVPQSEEAPNISIPKNASIPRVRPLQLDAELDTYMKIQEEGWATS